MFFACVFLQALLAGLVKPTTGSPPSGDTMAAREVGLSEDDWIEGLLADAEKRLAGRDSTQVAVVAAKQASLAKANKALAPQLKQVTEAPKKEDELCVRIPQPAAQKKKVRLVTTCASRNTQLPIIPPRLMKIYPISYDAARYPVMGDTPAP